LWAFAEQCREVVADARQCGPAAHLGEGQIPAFQDGFSVGAFVGANIEEFQRSR